MRKFLPSICIILVVLCSILGIKLATIDDTNEHSQLDSTDMVTPVRSSVYSGNITNTIIAKGRVIGDDPEVYMDKYAVDLSQISDKESFVFGYRIGEDLVKGDVLFSYDNKEVKTEYDCRIADVIRTEDRIEVYLLDYEKLYIVATVDVDEYELLDYDTNTEISYDKIDSHCTAEARIESFGYEISDGKIDVRVTSSEKLLPGSQVDVKFSSESPTESLYILKDMLLKDGDKYYVEVEGIDFERSRRNVQIGKTFEEYNDGTLVEFVEIISGLQVGENLIIDVIG